MNDQAKNVLIGLFVVVATIIIIWTLAFLHPFQGGEKKYFKVRFANIDKINVGTRVTFAGRPVGEIVAIEELPEQQRLGRNGFVYIFELTLSVDANLHLYETDEITLRTSGLLGEKSVAIIPQPVPIDKPLVPLLTEKTIYAFEGGSVEDTFKEFKEIADHFELTLDEVTKSFQTLNQEAVLVKISDAARHIGSIAKAFDRPETLHDILENTRSLVTKADNSWGEVDDILQKVNQGLEDLKENDSWHVLAQSIQNLQEILAAVNQPEHLSQIVNYIHALTERIDHSWPKVESSIDNLQASLQNLQKLSTHAAQGKGSVGKIFMDDDVYLRASSLFSKGETIADDINHYGLLFHLDKGWQRLRARRANLLQKLSSPQEFRNFFNDEINQISTSLSNVSQVLDKIDFADPCTPYFYDRDFRKVFAELLRRVEMMEEMLQMYNQQVVDKAETEFCR